MDQFDRAQEIDASFLKQALTMQQRVAAFSRDARTHCIDCGEMISKARLAVLPGCIRCIDCAEALELSQRRG